MIMGALVDVASESPGNNAGGQRVTYALENHCGGNVTVGSNPTPSAQDKGYVTTSLGARYSQQPR